MDEKLSSIKDRVLQLAKQEPRFAKELALGMQDIGYDISFHGERADEIYEYCIGEMLRLQAEDFYHDFPIPEICQTLIDDFVRMEAFWQKNQFLDFCLALYQQLEAVTNYIVPKIESMADKMWGVPAYVTLEAKNITDIGKRSEKGKEKYQVAHMVFIKEPEMRALQELSKAPALDKLRSIVYFVGYKAMPTAADFNNYIQFTSLLADIYCMRNRNHRSLDISEFDKTVVDRVTKQKSLYYCKFMDVLAQFISYVRENYKYIPSITSYSDSIVEKIPVRVRNQLKIVGHIQLSQEDMNKSRFLDRNKKKQ